MIYRCPDIQGWMNEDELQWLYNTSLQMNSVIEIGSWKGRSTHALLNGCKGPVYAVDHFKGNPDQIGEGLPHHEATLKDIYEDFKKNVGNYPNLFVMKMDSLAASRFFKKESVDMVFIDGCHRYEDVFRDLKIWMPICKYLLCYRSTIYP